MKKLLKAVVTDFTFESHRDIHNITFYVIFLQLYGGLFQRSNQGLLALVSGSFQVISLNTL